MSTITSNSASNIPSIPSSTAQSSSEVHHATLLRGWSSVTTRLLAGTGSDKCSAWNVLDGNFGNAFVDALWKELHDAKLLEKLLPARTKGDSSIFAASSLLSTPSASAAIITAIGAPIAVRGDKSLFLSREYRGRPDFGTRHPRLHEFISTISTTVVQNLKDDIQIDTTLTSVQLAVYPGDGQAGYLRHCDRGQSSCHSESQETPSSSPQRIITALYYLTDEDWDPVMDGGCLRIFADTTHDICPYRDRLVIFRSDGVEHQVMPSLRRPRTAITIWFYGNEIKLSTNTSVESSTSIPNGSPPSSNSILPLPLSNAPAAQDDQKLDDLPSIFVSIASYRDSETSPTLDALFASAKYPERVFVGLVLQNDPTHDKELIVEKYATNKNVRCLQLAAQHALGPCYARSLAQSLHRGETYVLQIDSHMRFRPNWDEYLIHLWQQTSSDNNNHPKVVLTAYPVGYHLPNQIPNETRGTLLVPWKFDNQGMLRQRGRLLQSSDSDSPASIPCLLYAAGFNFGPASIIKDVPYDPSLDYLFFGEELSMAIRLYTHGYNLYAPPETVVFHLWSRAHRPTLQSSETVIPPEAVEEKREASLKVVQQQLLGTSASGVFGLGNERTSKQFAQALGVDFRKSEISSEAPLGGLSPDRFAKNCDDTLFAEDSFEKKVANLDSKTQELIAFYLGGMDLS
jgi:[Skp1-protein]-hydroxyproline N-acetylglucosaminyltransferase